MPISFSAGCQTDFSQISLSMRPQNVIDERGDTFKRLFRLIVMRGVFRIRDHNRLHRTVTFVFRRADLGKTAVRIVCSFHNQHRNANMMKLVGYIERFEARIELQV